MIENGWILSVVPLGLFFFTVILIGLFDQPKSKKHPWSGEDL